MLLSERRRRKKEEHIYNQEGKNIYSNNAKTFLGEYKTKRMIA